jgi:hypothetical protein
MLTTRRRHSWSIHFVAVRVAFKGEHSTKSTQVQSMLESCDPKREGPIFFESRIMVAQRGEGDPCYVAHNRRKYLSVNFAIADQNHAGIFNIVSRLLETKDVGKSSIELV